MKNLYERIKPEVKKSWEEGMSEHPLVLEQQIKELKGAYDYGSLRVDTYSNLIVYGTNSYTWSPYTASKLIFER